MADHLTNVGYALSREQLIIDNPHLLARRKGWADRSAGHDACHPYLSTKDVDGYGKRRIRYLGQYITVPVSRIEIALSEGYIAADREAAHLCQNQTCVNPRHLEAMLPKDHRWYDAGPKRHKRWAKYGNGNAVFSVFTITQDDVARTDWFAEASEARLLAGHFVREMGLSWHEAHRVAARHADLPETPEFVECVERFYRNILVEPKIPPYPLATPVKPL